MGFRSGIFSRLTMNIPVATVTMQVLSHISHPPILAGGGALDSLSLSLFLDSANPRSWVWNLLVSTTHAMPRRRCDREGQWPRPRMQSNPFHGPLPSCDTPLARLFTTARSRVKVRTGPGELGTSGWGTLFTRWKRKEAGGRKK